MPFLNTRQRSSHGSLATLTTVLVFAIISTCHGCAPSTGQEHIAKRGTPICEGLEPPSVNGYSIVWPDEYDNSEQEGMPAQDVVYTAMHNWVRGVAKKFSIKGGAIGKLHVAHYISPCWNKCTVGLLPGLGESIYEYMPMVYELLARGCNVWAMDLPSQGDSERLVKEDRLRIHLPMGGFAKSCNAVKTFLQDFVLNDFGGGEERKFLFTHSTGGAYALCALLQPDSNGDSLASRFDRTAMSSPLWRIDKTRHLLDNLSLTKLFEGARWFWKPYGKFAHPKFDNLGYLPGSLEPKDYENRVDSKHIAFRNRGRDIYPQTRINGPTKGWVQEMARGLYTLRKRIDCRKQSSTCLNDLLILRREKNDPFIELSAIDEVCKRLGLEAASGCQQIILSIYHSPLTAYEEPRTEGVNAVLEHFALPGLDSL